MIRLTFLGSALALMLGLLSATPTHAADTHTPRLFTPKRTGDCYWFRDQRTVGNSTLVTQSGAIVNSEKAVFESVFEANATVIANNAQGKATQERFDVVTFTVSKDGGPAQEILPPGTRFTGKLKLGKKVFTDADGQPLPESITVYLDQIIALRDNAITDDDIFGPGHPVSVGDSWPVNANLAAEDFNFDLTLLTKAENLQGTVTLVDTDTLLGVPSVHLLTEMQLTKVKLPEEKGLRLIKGDLTFRSETWMPQTGPAYPVRQQTSLKLVLIGDPVEQNRFTPKRLMATSTIDATIESKPLPRDESVMELDRTLGIRR